MHLDPAGGGPFRTLLAVLLAALLGLTACGQAERGPEPVVVGVGSHPEQLVLGAIVTASLRSAGIDVEVLDGLGDTVALRRQAGAGQIDLYVDYTGAAWGLGLGEQAPPADPEESFARVAEADAAQGLRWLPPSRTNATFALAVRSEAVPEDTDPTMSWLAGQLSGSAATICAERDFLLRDGGLDALAGEYGIDLGEVRREEAIEAAAVAGVADGTCDAGLVIATSGLAQEAGLTVVADDLGVMPAFVIAPVVRAGSAGAQEEVAAALAPVMQALDTPTLARLNAEHAAGQQPSALAERYLAEVLGTAG